MRLAAIDQLQELRGVAFPVEYKVRQLIVTGPPGSGKSTLMSRIRGWPEEGYIDLALRGWWKAQSLSFRPREAHLGIPCAGFEDSLAVFDREWLASDPAPEIDYERIRIPPQGNGWLTRNWRASFVFEFLLPPAESILEWRLNRQSKGTHHVDSGLVLNEIIRQRQAYLGIAAFFCRSGMQAYIREGVEAPPKRISLERREAPDAALV